MKLVNYDGTETNVVFERSEVLTYAQDAARSGLSSERFLLALCEAESAERQVRRVEHAIATAKATD